MPIDILMPALSPSMEKGNLVRWLKSVGDPVSEGDVLAEIETDKATMEVEAGASGVLSRIVVAAGSLDVPVNVAIGELVTGSEGSIVHSAAAPTVQTAGVTSGHSGHFAIATAAPEQIEELHEKRVFASPIARRLIAEAGLDVSIMVGTGPKGRIVERDVKAAIEASARPLAAAEAQTPPLSLQPVPQPTSEPAQQPAPGLDDRTRELFEASSYVEVAHDAMRLTIARRLSEAKRTIPHFYLSTVCQIDALLALRQQLNDAAPAREGAATYRLSVNDFVVRALALALAQVPDANVSFTESAMLRHRHADIGVAVAIPGGLMTPVVRQAETKALSSISNEIKALAARAKERRLRPDEYQGGTASVSNLGMHGVTDFAAIINPPQASILAVGAAEKQAVVRGDMIEIGTMMKVTLSVDHRAIDGATGAELLAAFKAFVETPMTMLV